MQRSGRRVALVPGDKAGERGAEGAMAEKAKLDGENDGNHDEEDNEDDETGAKEDDAPTSVVVVLVVVLLHSSLPFLGLDLKGTGRG